MRKRSKFFTIGIIILVFTITVLVEPIHTKAATNAKIVTAAVGNCYSMFLKDDGTVWVSGSNYYAQLGQNPYDHDNVNNPIQIKGLSDVVAIAAGLSHCIAIKSDGTVWAWGGDEYGQLGSGGTQDYEFNFNQVIGLSDIVKVSTRGNFNLALKKDGTVWGWGDNSSYELGLGTNSPSKVTTPVCISTLNDVKDISAGYDHALAIKNDGTVWGWGDDGYGQLGDGTTTTKTKPTCISNLTDVKKISAGGFFSAALKNDGTIWTTGRNYDGELGDGTTNEIHKFTKVTNLEDCSDITTGDYQVFTIRKDGTVWSWGDNEFAEVGHDYEKDSYKIAYPAQIQNLNNISFIAAGSNSCIAISSDNNVYGWGGNSDGQLASGYDAAVEKPAKISTPGNVVGYSVSNHMLMVNDNGEAWQYGFDCDLTKTLYQGTGLDCKKDLLKIDPKFKIDELSNIKDVKASRNFSIALSQDGTVWSWGVNTEGQLGDGTYEQRTIPVKVKNLTNVIAISAGQDHAIALKDDGTVWMWGNDFYTVKNQNTPVMVQGVNDIVAIAADFSKHSLALKKDGTVWAWGSNVYGQLGNGYSGSVYSPVQVKNISGITAIATGYCCSFALKSDGTLWSWGSNNYGSLGDGTHRDENTPVQVLGINNVKQIAASGPNAAAIKNDGTVWVWGDNSCDQLAKDKNQLKYSTIPMKVDGIDNAKYVKAGNWSIMVQKNDGSLWGWGSNSTAPFGFLTSTFPTPKLIASLSNVKPKNDLNSDGVVDILDVALIASHYNTVNSSSNWEVTYDINSDGIVDIYDLTLVSKQMEN